MKKTHEIIFLSEEKIPVLPSIIDAAHQMALDLPGGINAIAVRMGMRPQVLSSKLNPNVHTHHLSLMEALKMQALTGRVDILRAMAGELGYTIMPLPTLHIEGDVAAAMAATCKEFADFLGEVSTSMSDGELSPNERRRIEKEMREMMAAAEALLMLVSEKQNGKSK